MADKTAIFESAQALFCSMADYIGTTKLSKVLDLKKYPTYKDFKSVKSNATLIDKAFKKTKLVGVSRKQIEDLLKDTSWYKSSVLIAVKLLDDITKINSHFGKVQNAGWQDLFYVRGARGGDTTMDNIDILFKYANTANKKFGDINKWSPADIYFVSTEARTAVQEEVKRADKNGTYTFLQLNTLCNGLVSSGNLLPLSLKKVENKVPQIVKYNFARKAEEKNLAKLTFISTKKSKSGRDIQIVFQNIKSQVKIRHDPHHTKFGASGTVKAEILVAGMGGRLGSIGTMAILLSVIKDAHLKSGNIFAAELKTAYDAGMKAYKKGIVKLNDHYDVKVDDSHSLMREFDSNFGLKTLYDDYQQERAELSQKTLMSKILPIIEKYFNNPEHTKAKKNALSDSTMMIQAFVKYASSRSPDSGQFVIAK
jgi:hypothetical protein